MGLRIDLGCGANRVYDCLGVDSCAQHQPDIIADITRRIPGLDDGSAEYVVCRHVLEHLDGDQWRDVFAEIARLLESGGRFEIRVPHPSCENSMIHGHRCVLTPHYWQQMQAGKIDAPREMAIDRVVEIPHPLCIEFCRQKGFIFDEWSRFLFNAYYETAIYGHRL